MTVTACPARVPKTLRGPHLCARAVVPGDAAGAADAGAAWERVEVAVPRALSAAAPRRLSSFLSGRYCAALALRDAGCVVPCDVGVGDGGAPIWPAGFVGAITHTARIAMAAVARLDVMAGLGIDSEEVVAHQVAVEIANVVLVESEHALYRDRRRPSPLDWPTFVTVVFSAKESLYKCLHPIAGEFFDFQDASVIAVDYERRRLRLRLDQPVGAVFERGTELDALFAIADGHVHTLVELPVGALPHPHRREAAAGDIGSSEVAG